MATDVATAFPEITVNPGATITVELDDASALVTKLNVYALNLDTGQIEELPAAPTLLALVPMVGGPPAGGA